MAVVGELEARSRNAQPQGPVQLNLAHQAFKGGRPSLAIHAPCGLVDMGGRPLTTVGSIGAHLAGNRARHLYATGSGNRIDLTFQASPPSAVFTVVVVFRVVSLSSVARLFTTANASNWVGVSADVTTSGQFEVHYGDNTATGSTGRRSFASNSSTVAIGRDYTAVATISGAATGKIWLNGSPQTVTTSGTAAGYSQGTASTGSLFGQNNAGTFTYGNQGVALVLVIPGAVSDTVAKSIGDNPWQLLASPSRRVWVPAAGPATHTTTGAMAADVATVDGTAARLALHTTSGALTGQAATISGAAVHPHIATGALTAQSATVAGTAADEHATTGALAADAASIAGTAAHTVAGTSHDGPGALQADAAVIAGSATHIAVHAASGALVAGSAAIAGSAVHPHTTAGALAASAATLDGVSARSGVTAHEATGALQAGEAQISGEAVGPSNGAGSSKRRNWQLQIGSAVITGTREEIEAEIERQSRKQAREAIEKAQKPEAPQHSVSVEAKQPKKAKTKAAEPVQYRPAPQDVAAQLRQRAEIALMDEVRRLLEQDEEDALVALFA